jgi:Kef-type K+ transport system membrane component KefB
MTHDLLFASADDTNPWLAALRRLSVEEVLLPLLLQLALIILAARAFAALFRRLGQPGAVGEMVAGLVLGPSVLGRIPAVHAAFHPGLPGVPFALADSLLGWILTALSQLGLIFLLFLIGLEFDFSHLRWHGRAALAVALAGIALPFGLGAGLAWAMHPHVTPGVQRLGFTLFFGTALSITAIPMLGRIMMELGITRTRLGALTIAAAAVDDAAGWTLLAAVAAVVRAEYAPDQTVWMVAETVGFTLLMVLAGRPLRYAARLALRRGDGEIGVTPLAVLVALIFGCAMATNRIGIFAVFGAFLVGAVLSGEHDFRQAVNRRLRDFVTAFFLPLFFAYTGLRTDVGSLGTWQLGALAALVCAAGVLGKFGGCTLAALLSRYPWREAACIGVLMNTRALIALIVINLGKDLGVLTDSAFCMLILMALVTTLMTTPLLVRLMPGTELEPYIRRSGFAPPPAPPVPDPAAADR